MASSSPANIGPPPTNVGPNPINIGPTSANIGPTAANIGPTSINIGPSSANIGPTSANIGLTPTNVGQNTANRDQWVVIGVSGVTCGGKTTLANRLRDALSPSYVFHQDKYFFPDDSPRHIRCDDLPHNNYDILSSLDMPAMHDDILATIGGQNRAHTHNLEGTTHFDTKGMKFIIQEGFTVLNYKPLNDLCDLRYYFVLEYSECLSRRCFRLYDPPDVAGYFERCVWPEHLRYRAEIEKDKRVTLVDGTRQDTFDVVMAQIKDFCNK